MKYLIMFFVLIGPKEGGCLIKAQDTLPAQIKNISFRATVNTPLGISRGYLTSINDTSFSISVKSMKFNPATPVENTKNVKTFPYESINSVTMRRKGDGGRGALIGGVSLMLVGVIAGFIAGDDPYIPPSEDFLGLSNAFRTTAGQKALAGGLVGLFSGTLLGCLAGNIVHKSFNIGRNKKNFDDMRQQILNKAYETPR